MREGRGLLMLERESEVSGVEGNGAAHVADLVANTVKPLDETLRRSLRHHSPRFDRSRHPLTIIARSQRVMDGRCPSRGPQETSSPTRRARLDFPLTSRR